MINLKDYDQATQEMVAMATDQLKSHKEYQRLLAQWEEARANRNMVKQFALQAKIKNIEAGVMERLLTMDIERRKSVKVLKELLESIDHDDFLKYQDLMSCLCFLLDMIEFTFHDINEVLDRHHIGVRMDNFPELVDARNVCEDLANKEVKKMNDYERDIWYEEADRIWEYMKQRAAVYRRKVDRKEAKGAKTCTNHLQETM